MVYQKKTDITLLKAFVYLMGIIMMVGTIALVSIIYKRNSSNLQDNTAFNKVICNGGNISLHSIGNIENMFVKDNKLFLLTKHDDIKQYIYVIDYCDGEVLNKISIDFSEKGKIDLIKQNNAYTG